MFLAIMTLLPILFPSLLHSRNQSCGRRIVLGMILFVGVFQVMVIVVPEKTAGHVYGSTGYVSFPSYSLSFPLSLGLPFLVRALEPFSPSILLPLFLSLLLRCHSATPSKFNIDIDNPGPRLMSHGSCQWWAVPAGGWRMG